MMVDPPSVTFVGEANPYGLDPRFALYHLPSIASGGRLQRLICGITPERYESLGRLNLCPRTWSAKEARLHAAVIRREGRPVVVLLGRKVADAFGLHDVEPFSVRAEGVTTLVLLPHPSGLSRAWDEPEAVARARAILRDVAPAVPWGELDEPKEH
jgi:hypothetical protein